MLGLADFNEAYYNNRCKFGETRQSVGSRSRNKEEKRPYILNEDNKSELQFNIIIESPDEI